MKNIILLLVCFLPIEHATKGQTVSKRDSLLDILRTMPNIPGDTNRIIVLYELAFQYYQNKPDTTFLLGQQAYELSRQIKYTTGEARAMNVMALGFNQLGDYAKSLKMFKQVKELYTQLKNTQRLAITLNNMANVYMFQNEWQKGLETLQETYALYKTIDEPNARFEPVILVNIGECFYNLKQLDSATFYLNLALPLTKKLYPELLGLNLQDLGDVAFDGNKTSQALFYYQQSIVASEVIDSYTALNEIYYRVSRFYQKTSKLDSSIYYANHSLTYGQKASYLPGIIKASQLLSEIYEKNNAFEALRFYKVAIAAKDSLFSQEKVKQLLAISFDEKQEAIRIEAAKIEYQRTIRFYILIGILAVFGTLAIFLFYNNRQKKKANLLLSRQKEEINFQKNQAEKALGELKSTQSQLIQSEKMASLGELTAGIAHEIQNPLNFVNNFSELNKELIDELEEGIRKGDEEEVKTILKGIRENEDKVMHHGKRAEGIVKSMLQHSRASSGQKEPTDLNALADEYLRLAYHGFKAKDTSFNANLKTDFNPDLPKVSVIPQDMGRVLLNLINNAFHAVSAEALAKADSDYKPEVVVSTKLMNDKLLITVSDNGPGIPDNIKEKIFQPFFTTKPTGQGTGLGLSLSYDIVKAHGGELKVESEEGEGSKFVITLPTV